MWKLKFYKIISDIDSYISSDEASFHKLVDTIHNDILSLQLILVNINYKTEKYSQSHLITFALTAYCDEKLNIMAISSGLNHEMLQTRLFKTLEAGAVYYQYLEYILTQRSQVNADLYWTYYYLLIHGFKGKYDSDKYFERSLYLRQLKILIMDSISLTLSVKNSLTINCSLKKISYLFLTHARLLPMLCLVASFVFINYL
jgi:type VI secretion system protein ImpK